MVDGSCVTSFHFLESLGVMGNDLQIGAGDAPAGSPALMSALGRDDYSDS